MALTPTQKKILQTLLDGGSVAAYGNHFRVRDESVSPVLKFTYKTFKPIKDFLRKKNGCFVLDLMHIRSLRKDSWIKTQYLNRHNEKKSRNNQLHQSLQ
jgi:hypothetical protein